MTRRHLNMLKLSAALIGAALLLSTTAVSAQDDCKPTVKKKLDGLIKSSPEQIAAGKSSYEINCIACHGEKGDGEGPAGKVLKPKPRNFTSEKLVNTSAVLGIYKTLSEGYGAAMPAFDSLPETERIALAHYIRTFVPEKALQNSTPAQVNAACVEMSNPKLPPIPIHVAMIVLAEEAEAARKAGRADQGPVKLNEAGQAAEGQAIFGMMCVGCHGDKGQGKPNYGRYGRYPFVTVSTFALQNTAAHGTWNTFAKRIASGAHATLPDMTDVATLNDVEWKSLQSFMATMPGGATVTDDKPAAPVAPKPALLGAGEGYELFWKEGKIFKLNTTPAQEGDAAVEQVVSYDAFRALYKGTTELPEALPTEGALELEGVVGLDCIGRTTKTEEKFGCGDLGVDTQVTDKLSLTAETFAPPPSPKPVTP